MTRDKSSCERCGRPLGGPEVGCTNCSPLDLPTIAPTPNRFEDETILPTTSPASITSTKRVGDYNLIEEIARGGMGVVYKAKHRNLNRLSAVKMILGGRFSSEEERQRFRIEAESAAKLDHPSIVPIFEIGECDGQAFFAMKYIDGGSLADQASNLVAKPREAVAMMVKVVEAVHHAHQRGILHRDLKPANILLDIAGEPFVTDLGLAKSTTGGSDLTHTGAILGTPSYMPPEQAAGQAVTTAADVYSLGAIFYELLVGRPPYQGETSVIVVMQVLDGPPLTPQKLNPGIDRELELICLKAMERDPQSRYSSAQEMANDLKAWLAGKTISIKPPSIRALFANWLKQNQKLSYIIFALLIALLFCSPVVFSLLSSDLGNVYDRFPDGARPAFYKMTFSPWLSIASSMLLLLVIWPSVGVLNSVISKPKTAIQSLKSGITTGAILTLILYVLVGWLIFIQGVNNSTRSKTETLTKAVWPTEESNRSQAMEAANDMFPGLKEIPDNEKARLVAKRLAAERYASAQGSFGVAILFAIAFMIPIVYGTLLAHTLSGRNLPMWLFLLRYLIAWWCVSALALALGFGIGSVFNEEIVFMSDPKSAPFAIAIFVVITFMALRKWRPAPALA